MCFGFFGWLTALRVVSRSSVTWNAVDGFFRARRKRANFLFLPFSGPLDVDLSNNLIGTP